MKKLLAFVLLLTGIAGCSNDPGQKKPAKGLLDSLQAEAMAAASRSCNPELCSLLAAGRDTLDYDKVSAIVMRDNKLNCFCEFEGEYTKLAARIPVVKAFVKNKTRRYTYLQTPLQYAVSCFDTILMHIFLEHGADPNLADSGAQRPMEMALNAHSPAMLSLLASFKGNLENCYIDPRWLSEEELEKAVTYGADFNVPEIEDVLTGIDPETRLPKLVKTVRLPLQQVNEYDKLEIMLKAGARPNDTTSGGVTLLHYLVQRGMDTEVDLALSYKADIYARDYADKTPLHYAAENCSQEILAKLLPLYDLKKAKISLAALAGTAEKAGCRDAAAYIKKYAAAKGLQ